MKAKFETLSKDQFAAWEQWKRGVEQAAANATSAVLHQMEARAKDVAAGQFKGVGRLAGSITVRKDSKLSGKVGPTVIYGRIQELGGTISPQGLLHLRSHDAADQRLDDLHPRLQVGPRRKRHMPGKHPPVREPAHLGRGRRPIEG